MKTVRNIHHDNSTETKKVIPEGYYIKARYIRYSWIAHSAPVVREVWDYLLREANHKDVKYDGFTVHRGQLFRSYPDIREDLSWYVGYRKEQYSENQMKHAMKLLKNHSMITLTKKPRGCLITIINYDIYQNPANYESTNEQSNNHPMNQPSINQSSPSINKNDKNEKNDNNLSADFENFWNRYHSVTGKPKTDKEPAKKYWKKLNKLERGKAVQNIKPYFDSLNDKQYCKKARTYLSDKNYNDEFKQSTSIDDLTKGLM